LRAKQKRTDKDVQYMNSIRDRTDFNRKAEDILDFMDTYGMIRYIHLDKFFPKDKKVIKYLIKHQRLFISFDGTHISIDEDLRPDKTLTAALGVLSDVLEKVKAYSKASPPAQLSFVTHSGDYYEVIYVAYGMEAMVSSTFELQQAAQRNSENYVDFTKRMVIVEDKSQMLRLKIPATVRFALVEPRGNLTYFKA